MFNLLSFNLLAENISENIMHSLKIMGYGLLAIFVVIGILIVLIQIVVKLDNSARAKRKAKKDAENDAESNNQN